MPRREGRTDPTPAAFRGVADALGPHLAAGGPLSDHGGDD